MRFFEDGPDIPDALIEARELGEVVFFCGAGVSAPAGLPDFYGLADALLVELAADESRSVRDRGETLDRVFTAMVKEFGGAAVDRELTRALRTPRKADLRYHRAVIDLSRGADGAAKIVTTNFDLLFERADRTLRGYVPPTLPDLTQLQPIQGVVYLHGRLSSSGSARAGYVISSADFGRAYLAEGWAARFVRDLSERYTIILLGYSGNDPPMRYLLEGLSSREGTERRPIYAFAPEGAAASDESWRDKGVTTIAYRPRDKRHTGLWDSLFAWAEAARDGDGWRNRIVVHAQADPSKLQPFERGQVVHLVGTKAGAAAFASATPPPPADWLCVLDAKRRYAEPLRLDWRDEEEIDPLELFGLDSDPPRPARRADGGNDAPGEDPIRWRRGDPQWPERLRLSGYHPQWTSQLPPRLYHLARWFGSVIEQPAAVWWASATTQPHPELVREIRYRLDRGPGLPAPALHFWRCYLEAVQSRRQDPHDYRLYEIGDRAKSEGWSNAFLRELERVVMPFFEIGRPTLVSPLPPSGDWADLALRSIVEIKVAVAPWPDNRLEPPPQALPKVVEILRRSLLRMAEMLGESTIHYWRTPTLHPSGRRGESPLLGRKSGHFLTFKRLFDALVKHDIQAARREVGTWEPDEPFFFAKFFLYAATVPVVLDAEEVARGILAMSDSVFWDSDLAREMLFALRERWPTFQPATRRRIERRIMAGPPLRDAEPSDDHALRSQIRAATWLRWLELNGRTLTPVSARWLAELRSADTSWSDEWAANAAEASGSWGGFVPRVTDPQGLEVAPITDLITLAESLSTDDHHELRDYRPFDGVVGTAPFRALAALRLVARRGEWPEQFWRSVVANWPEGTRSRLTFLLAYTLGRLPSGLFAAVRFEIGDWTRKFAGGLIRCNRSAGLKAFDALTERFLSATPELLESGIGTATVAGVPKLESEYSVNKAINGPGGDLMMTLVGLISPAKRRRKMPGYVGERLNQLLRLPGDGAGHAACILARHFTWLNYWYRAWALGLLPLFELEHPLAEAMWHGLAADTHLLDDQTGALLKPTMLRLLAGEASWLLDADSRERIIQHLVNLTFPHTGKPVISFAEARRALMNVSDEERAAAISVLANSLQNEQMWSRFIKPFIQSAWPRQLKFQSQASARSFASLLENAGEHFPEAVDLVLPYLRPIPHLDTFAYRLKKQDPDGQGYSERFPHQTLQVLDAVIGDEQQTAPWNLSELLEAVADNAPALRQSDPWRRLRSLTQ